MTNKVPILTFVFDRKHTATATHAAAVEVRVTVYKSQKYISTGVRLYQRQWKNGNVINRPDAKEIQESLDLFMRNVRRVVNQMYEEGCLNLAELRPRLSRFSIQGETFLEYCARRTEVRKYQKSEDTCERYDRFLKFMMSWGKIVAFSDVTDQNIIQFDDCLTKRGMKPYSKWNNYHRFLNSFILDAIDDGLLKRNPYKWLHIEKEKDTGIQKYLTLEEFRRIATQKMPTKSLERVRDLFVFQTYTCLSYTDLADFDISKATTVGTSSLYTGKRHKTGQEFSFILLAPAKKILDKYNGKLPIISNVKYNEYLKIVAQAAGIDKPISTHWARHTGATMLLNDGNVDMEVIAKILGHSSTAQTRKTYAKLLDKTIVKSMSDFEKRIK